MSLILISVAPGHAETPLSTAHYSGAISSENNHRFFDDLAAAPVQRLQITSNGGEVEAAIELASWVFRNKLDIEVPKYCLSSCANYVFPAANHKTVEPGAIVAWHGNFHHLLATGRWRDDIAARVDLTGEAPAAVAAQLRAEVEALVELEREFFERIGVDQYLCWIGKMPPYNAQNYYFLSASDMGRFGVTRLTLPPDYENTDVSGFIDHIVFIDLVAEEAPWPQRSNMRVNR